jgi:hypothetical protein
VKLVTRGDRSDISRRRRAGNRPRFSDARSAGVAFSCAIVKKKKQWQHDEPLSASAGYPQTRSRSLEADWTLIVVCVVDIFFLVAFWWQVVSDTFVYLHPIVPLHPRKKVDCDRPSLVVHYMSIYRSLVNYQDKIFSPSPLSDLRGMNRCGFFLIDRERACMLGRTDHGWF